MVMKNPDSSLMTEKTPPHAVGSPSQNKGCDLCACPSFKVFSQKGRHGTSVTTVICEECGLVYTHPRPLNHENSGFYQNNYWREYKNQQTPDEKFFKRRIPKIQPLLDELRPFLRPGMNILECGCSVGALLSCMKDIVGEKGKVIGIEPDQKQSEYARERKGLDVRTGLIQEITPTLAQGDFDLIVMNHVLEHTTSPTEILYSLRDLLKTNGFLILEVPNIEAPGSRLSHFFHAAHPFCFSPATLRRLAYKTRYTVERIETRDGDLPNVHLFAVLRKPEPLEKSSSPEVMRDDPEIRAEALKKYERWYWLTGASFRKKITHWIRQR